MMQRDDLSTEQLQELDREHHMHPFTDHGSLNKTGTRVITKADGVYLWDSEGHKMLDGMAGLWCVAVGYGRTELAQAAYDQMQELPYYNSFFQCTTPPTIKLAEKSAEVAPKHVNNVFFTGSGSESNDTVLRLVRHYWKVQGEPQKSVMISDRVAQLLNEKGGDINHGFTYSGHPAAAAVALKNLEIIQQEKLIEKVANETGPYLQKRWHELLDSPIVGETRGVGLVCALELVKNKDTRERWAADGKAGAICRDFCIENGLVMRATGDIMLISPPLTISREEIDELIEKARKSLDDTLNSIKVGALEEA